MALKSKEELKAYFQTGDKPTQEQFEDLINATLAHKGFLDFTGRCTLSTNNRWVGTSVSYGSGSENIADNAGTSELPAIRWNSLGIGFLPKGSILHKMEFVGRTNSLEVEDLLVQLSYQGINFDNGGYPNGTDISNKIILNPTLASETFSD